MEPDQVPPPEPGTATDPARLRRLEEIFGDEPGSDRRDTGGDRRAREDWYRENRPPHHDGP